MKFIHLFIFSLALFSCSTAHTEKKCMDKNCETQTEPAARATDVPGVLIGMTRDEVVKILGPDFESHSPLSRPPSVDSFPYKINGEAKYAYVTYKDGVVLRAESGFTQTYRVY